MTDTLADSFDVAVGSPAERAGFRELSRLETICRDSLFTAMTEALAALAEKDGKKFSVSAQPVPAWEWGGQPELFFKIGYKGEADAAAPKLSGPISKADVIAFKITADKITCIRDGHKDGHEYGRIECANMTQAKEQITDWIYSVAPDRAEELQQQMATAAAAQRATLARFLRGQRAMSAQGLGAREVIDRMTPARGGVKPKA